MKIIGYTHFNGTRWTEGRVKHNEDYLPIETDENGEIIAPSGLVDQIANDKIIETKNQIDSDYETKVQSLTAGIPESEIKTWTKQESEARGYTADNTYPTPLIDALVTERGVPKDYLVSKILEKADMYAKEVGKLTGARQKAEDQLGV